MATAEVEKRIRQLDPKYLKELLNFLDYLLYVQEQQPVTNGKGSKKSAAELEAEATLATDEEVPERLRILRKYRGIAPKPHFPVTKYDVYEQ